MPAPLRIPFLVRCLVTGDWACFTRPEMKVERVTYDCMTPSGARGILEAIYWKPEIVWRIDRIHVLKPIRFINIRRNEVASVISSQTADAARRSGSGSLSILVEDDRQQRASILLRDVAYVIEAHFDLVASPPDRDRMDELAKHHGIAKRRMSAGQCFYQPYLGTREFPTDFRWIETHEEIPSSELPQDQRNQELGYMLYDIDHGSVRTPRFFKASLKDGVLEVPPHHSKEFAS